MSQVSLSRYLIARVDVSVPLPCYPRQPIFFYPLLSSSLCSLIPSSKQQLPSQCSPHRWLRPSSRKLITIPSPPPPCKAITITFDKQNTIKKTAQTNEVRRSCRVVCCYLSLWEEKFIYRIKWQIIRCMGKSKVAYASLATQRSRTLNSCMQVGATPCCLGVPARLTEINDTNTKPAPGI